MNKTICFYHNADLDGLACAAIVKQLKKDSNIKFIGVNYGDALDRSIINKEDTVIICDFSFTPEVMEWIAQNSHLIWIDHHKSAREKNPQLWLHCNGLRNENYAACVLTWQYFHGCDYYNDDDVPLGIRLIGDRDIWKFEYGNITKYWHEYLCVQVETFEDLELLLFSESSRNFSARIMQGRLLYKAKLKRIEYHYSNGFDGLLDGHSTIFINTSMDISDTGDYACKQGYEIACMFCFRKDENMIFASLRSKTVDVSEIAKKYGGGGHLHAAGFKVFRHTFFEKICGGCKCIKK